MKILLLAGLLLIGAASSPAASPSLSSGAEKWLNWTNPNIEHGVSLYANQGTVAVNAAEAERFGDGISDITFTSNNGAPVSEHQFGNALWGAGTRTSLFDPDALNGRTGIELLVELDPESTSSNLSIKLLTGDESDPYVQTVPVGKGAPQLVQFPLTGFSNKSGAPLDPAELKGLIQISGGWEGHPGPKLSSWKIRVSDLYTYGE